MQWQNAKPPPRSHGVGLKLAGFEFEVAVAVSVLEEEAYGAKIYEFIQQRTGRNPAIAQVYLTLARLEKKGLLRSRQTNPRPVKGGRSRKVFALEDRGVLALENETAARKAMVDSAIAERTRYGAIDRSTTAASGAS
jgi:DNA-binding PadR family transcriptional regulator